MKRGGYSGLTHSLLDLVRRQSSQICWPAEVHRMHSPPTHRASQTPLTPTCGHPRTPPTKQQHQKWECKWYQDDEKIWLFYELNLICLMGVSSKYFKPGCSPPGIWGNSVQCNSITSGVKWICDSRFYIHCSHCRWEWMSHDFAILVCSCDIM